MFKPALDNKPQPDSHAFDRYVDPTGEFTNRDLRFAEWYLKHKIWLRQLLTGFLFFLCIIFGGFSLYKIIEYTFYGYGHDQAELANLTRLGVALKTTKAEISAIPLNIEPVLQFPSSPGKYDFMAFVENPNERWTAHVYYDFAWEGGETAVSDFWLWPRSKSPLALIGVGGDFIPDTSRLNIKKIDWYRLDNHVYPDPAGYVNDRLSVTAEDLVFSPANPSLGLSISQTKFNLKNKAAFGYWQAPLIAVLKKGDVIVGVKQFIVDSLRPDSSTPVELTSLVETLDLDAVEVYPNLDLFDNTNYLPFKK